MISPLHAIALSAVFALMSPTATAAPAHANTHAPAPVSPSTASATPTAAPAPTTVADTPATLRVFNREIIVLRANLLHNAPAQRVDAAQRRIGKALERNAAARVEITPTPFGHEITLDGRMMLLITPDDIDTLEGQTLPGTAQNAAEALRGAIAETRESRDTRAMLRAAAQAAGVTALGALLLWSARRARRWLETQAQRHAKRHGRRLQVARLPLLSAEQLVTLTRRVVRASYALLVLLMLYAWLSFVLARFPYTRVWGEQLRDFLFGVIEGVARGAISAVPGMVVALVIFALARFATRSLSNVFDRVQEGRLRLGWLDRDVVAPTRRLSSAIVWLFALAMAYPYLPGAQTEAFKGLSVLVGLMLSVGASGLVGQAASGLILTFSRSLRVGEYVRVGEFEGTVTDLGTFTTRIRTGLGEELSLPNTLILGAVTTNYSRAVNGPGYVLDTTVTIGYDTPWRQVHALLIEAAQRTEGVVRDPAPTVFQTALSDFYVEYRLVCQAIPSQPRPRAAALNSLHANIQDVFNEHGVQIMSPHYLGDPARAKIVPPLDWYPPPAQRP